MQSSRLLKRIDKKLRKHQHTLNKHTGVNCIETPSKFLAICNVGQANGLTEDDIIENFQQFGSIDQIRLIPGASYCFLSFKQISSATEAMTNHNGTLKLAQDNKPIFLSYTEYLPDIPTDAIANNLPYGLIILEDFISEQEENELLNLHQSNDSNLKYRQVKHYGYKFRYDINNVDKDKPLAEKIPEQCNFLWVRLRERNVLPYYFIPDQLTINQYKPGQGIPPHIDTHSAFEDPIMSLSLGSPVVMEFKKNRNVRVLLPRRSLTIMSGESRYAWSHGITPKKFDFIYTDNGGFAFKRDTRISFTFRKVLQGECHCQYTSYCDSYNKSSNQLVDTNKVADLLENLHVHNVYEDIADHFSDTRHKPWPNVLNFVQSFPFGSILVDVGCGNGKYFGHRFGNVEIGIDRSFKLNEVCKGRGFESCAANCLNLPLQDSVADGVLSIAVIHHLATEARRLQAIQEIHRILRIGGSALIYVWAKNQLENNEKSSYIKQDRRQRKTSKTASVEETNKEVKITDSVVLPVHNNRTNFNYNDMLVPWKLKKSNQGEVEETFLRFYHVFEKGELEILCSKLTNIEIIRSYYDQGNHCIIFKKIK